MTSSGGPVLALETSCDETAAAVVTPDGDVLANVVSSQAELHRRYGGVVPEVASRRHLELVDPVVREALTESRVRLDELGSVAATQRGGPSVPSSSGCRPPRRSRGPAGCRSCRVDHLHGHVASLYLRPEPLEPPFLCLLASGGHTLLLAVHEPGGYDVLGTTLDDAAGEAFDKGARLLGLGYPGGAAIDRLARDGDPAAYAFPVARVPGLDFSFSGLKTALLYVVRELDDVELQARRADLAAAYQRAIVRALAGRAAEALEQTGPARSPSWAAWPRTRSCASRCRMPFCAARAVHRQRGDDRVRRAVPAGRPLPRLPCARCISVGRVAAQPRPLPPRGAAACRSGHRTSRRERQGGAARARSGSRRLAGAARRADGTEARRPPDRRPAGPVRRGTSPRAGGLATEAEMKGWAAAASAAQRVVLSRLAFRGAPIDPEYTYVRVLNGFAAPLDARAVALLERDPLVSGVYAVRAGYPAAVAPAASAADIAAAASVQRVGVELPGFDGAGVTVALLDTGLDSTHPYIRSRLLPGIDIVDPGGDASARPHPAVAGRPERHGTELAGIVVGGRVGPGGPHGVAPGASLLPIRVAGWQPDTAEGWRFTPAPTR